MQQTCTIKHQFCEESFYNPTWEIRHLFLGTFNPLGGKEVNYYYGRNKNKCWELLSILFKEDIKPTSISIFFKQLEKHGIACMDLIDFVACSQNQIDNILGKGYKDSAIINSSVIRKYNTDQINQVVLRNPDIKIYSTWGEGSSLKEWKSEVAKIDNIIKLKSPSMAAKVPKGCNKLNYMLADWQKHIVL